MISLYFLFVKTSIKEKQGINIIRYRKFFSISVIEQNIVSMTTKKVAIDNIRKQ
ncbi:MAG: hypothetical protein GYA51_13845 [Candidatus Methanofastidiosa archaeon]|nr:hypothetical protein [Candidatus Methanofastidiosa archaeon]